MKPARLTRSALAGHLMPYTTGTRRVVRALRAMVLRTAPNAAEAVRFRVLCYYRPGAWFGSIGGNIAMIEIKERSRARAEGVMLSFIHGSHLPDPAGILRGSAKFKRFVHVPDIQTTRRPELRALVRAARDLRPWD